MGVISDGLGRTLLRDDLSLKTSGAETASTTGTAVELGDKRTMNIEVAVTAASGTTPTLTVDIEGSHDGLTWYQLARIGSNGFRLGGVGTAPADITTTGTHRATVPAARYVRYKSNIAGTTPSFTYSVGGSST
jgi:hypothetical protein